MAKPLFVNTAKIQFLNVAKFLVVNIAKFLVVKKAKFLVVITSKLLVVVAKDAWHGRLKGPGEGCGQLLEALVDKEEELGGQGLQSMQSLRQKLDSEMARIQFQRTPLWPPLSQNISRLRR